MSEGGQAIGTQSDGQQHDEPVDGAEQPNDDRASARSPLAAPATTAATPVWPGLVLVALGVASIAMSLRLEILTDTGAGPGLWPLMISVVMVCTAAIVVARPALRSAEPTTRTEAGRVGVGLLLLGAYAVLMPAIGLVSASVIVGALWLRLLTRDSWLTALAVPTGAALVLYVVFVLLLEVAVPVDAFLPR